MRLYEINRTVLLLINGSLGEKRWLHVVRVTCVDDDGVQQRYSDSAGAHTCCENKITSPLLPTWEI